MNLASPVTVQPSPLTIGGKTWTFPAITISSLNVTLIDNVQRRICLARLLPCPRPLVLWQGDEYDEAGDYTQAEAEARITELLGADPAAVLKDLY